MRAALLSLLLAGAALAAPPENAEYESAPGTPPVPLAEMPGGVTHIRIEGTLADKGKATLSLTSRGRAFSEAGEPVGPDKSKTVQVKCSLSFVKKLAIRAKPKARPVQRNLYRLEGKDLASKLFLLGPGDGIDAARLLVHDKDGKVVQAVELKHSPPNVGCHPGCFPAGTPVATPGGPRPVEAIRVGDQVTTVDAAGKAGTGKVLAVFTEDNKLLLVETDAGTLVTTPSQPLSRADGRIVATRELKPGDEIHRWQDGKRVAARVKSVTDSGRKEKVFNLVLGGSEVFVADGYLARSKPPRE